MFDTRSHALRQPAVHCEHHRLGLDEALHQPRIAIEDTEPVLDHGRFAVKAVAGQPLTVTTRILTDGHDQIGAALYWGIDGEAGWHRQRMRFVGSDLWQAEFTPLRVARHLFVIEAWWDVYESFRHDLQKKHATGMTVSLELEEGRQLLDKAREHSQGEVRALLEDLLLRLGRASHIEAVGLLLGAEAAAAMSDADPHLHRSHSNAYPLEVERERAQFASWYELFPRSQTDDPGRHGTFRDVIARLPAIHEMGFDVLYFPPIHPIGRRFRKGRNNSLEAAPEDPGSPYAIGGEEGGHEAIHPQLGSREDFRALVAAAGDYDLEIALDFAVQCSQDHPWLKEHPGWFSWRPDGSIRYAENPPKKYQDIVNVEFYTRDAVPDLWLALRDLVLGWIAEGVKTFRVDNPHTKPLPFWEWLIAEVRGLHPEVIFLSEAFTRPPMMARLGKLGFSQSYTYFTWRNTKEELADYLSELNRPPLSHCLRPHFFVNTPDINPFFLQYSGRAGFLIRAVLASMGSGLWGMYSGFELCESAALPGKEEYLDSEKFQIRPRDYQAPGNIVEEIARFNRIRRQNPALQTHLGLQLYNAWNDNILLFGKRTADLSNFILVAVNLDPFNAQEAHFELPLWEFGLPDHASMHGEDLMNGHRWTWHGKVQWTRLDPACLPFGIWRLSQP